ncbi:MAG TPA: molybdopterin-dependent oxidoreductase [Bauldia sp.]|nr:molybdopterin-dependent oxidoreductase [Bauldia sp.]
MANPDGQRIPCFCALCVSRCGAVATVADGRFVALDADPEHPTGQALCLKGKVAPEIVYHQKRLLRPLKRTRPKGAADAGWVEIGWDEALDTVAANLRRLAAEHGPESVVFTTASPSTSAMSDAIDWVMRLRRAYGSPNHVVSMELCGWGRYLATAYTFGVPVPGVYMPDLDRAGCILFWGYNPSLARIVHATAAVAALNRGARLVVVDPRRVGLAHRADRWLRVRPGTDTALALSIAHVMIEHGWFDRDFVRDWTNAPLLVREDNGRLLREADISPSGEAGKYVAWDIVTGRPVAYDARGGVYGAHTDLALAGAFDVPTPDGTLRCRPVLALLAELCRRYEPRAAERITGVDAGAIEATARLLWEQRPVAYYAWSGVEQHTNATQMARAIAQICVLTGSLDVPGGNVLFAGVPANKIDGAELLSPAQRAKALGLAARPLGPSRWEFVTSGEVYDAALDGKPYKVRGVVGFGANLVMAHADSARARDALASLDFMVHADLFMNPTAELADIVLPVASAFETEALRVGFEVSEDAQAHVQLRRRISPARGESRADIDIVFDLAQRLGLGDRFFGGDIEAAWRHQIAPSGITLEALRAEPRGIRAPVATRHRKYAEARDGAAAGFPTPTRKIELYCEEFLDHGYPPLPEFTEPPVSPRSQPDLAARYPLILTSAKDTHFCETQHRNVASLRRRAPDPQVELHPEAAAARGIAAGDWVRILTPVGSVRARARLNEALSRDVVSGQHGWWEPCEEIGAPGYDPFGPDGANLNLLIDRRAVDPVSGTAPHRSFMCDVALDAR